MTEEVSVRIFDGLTPKKGQIKASNGVQRLSTAMWSRILEQIELKPHVYYAANSASVPRIGYGRRFVESQEEVLNNFNVEEEARWLKHTLEVLYQRVITASPNAPLEEVLRSVLYYYDESYS